MSRLGRKQQSKRKAGGRKLINREANDYRLAQLLCGETRMLNGREGTVSSSATGLLVSPNSEICWGGQFYSFYHLRCFIS